jgi:hypothetical protein
MRWHRRSCHRPQRGWELCQELLAHSLHHPIQSIQAAWREGKRQPRLGSQLAHIKLQQGVYRLSLQPTHKQCNEASGQLGVRCTRQPETTVLTSSRRYVHDRYAPSHPSLIAQLEQRRRRKRLTDAQKPERLGASGFARAENGGEAREAPWQSRR